MMAAIRCWFPPAVIAVLLSLAGVSGAGAWQDTLAEKGEAAKQALLAGDYAKAVVLYRELAAALPDNPGLRLNLGLALAKAGQPSAAVPELERASRGLPSSAGAWFLLGMAYQELHQPKLAIAPLRKAVQLDGGNQQARFELADAELATGETRKAINDFEILTRQNPSLPKAWQGLGMSCVALSESFFGQLDRSEKESAYWYALLARSRAAEQQYDAALELYRKALQKAPAIKGLHAARADIYRETGHADWAAVEEAREAQIPKPDCALHRMACAFEAQDWIKTMAGVGQVTAAEDLYWATLGAGKLAEQSFQRLSELPSSPETHEILAEGYQRAGHRMDAIEQWREALAMQPDNQRLQGRLAESLVRAREYDEAGQLLMSLVAAQPGDVEWQYFLGKVLFEQGRLNEALPPLTLAVRSLPAYLPAQEVLGRVYLALGQPADALPYLLRALPLDDDGSISFALSVAYRRLSRTAESQAALVRYRKLTHDRGEATSSANRNTITPP